MPWFSMVILTRSRFLASLFKLEKKKKTKKPQNHKTLRWVKKKILLLVGNGGDQVMMSETQAAARWAPRPPEPDRSPGNVHSSGHGHHWQLHISGSQSHCVLEASASLVWGAAYTKWHFVKSPLGIM